MATGPMAAAKAISEDKCNKAALRLLEAMSACTEEYGELLAWEWAHVLTDILNVVIREALDNEFEE
jgi:hypothetical protein